MMVYPVKALDEVHFDYPFHFLYFFLYLLFLQYTKSIK